MTNEELVLQIRQGDPGIELLWERVQKLVQKLANEYYSKGFKERPDIDLDDLMQSGFLAVLDAVEAFDPAKGYKFTAYLHYHCANHFNALAGIRSESRRNNPVAGAIRNAKSLDAPVVSDDEDFTLLDLIPDPGANFEDVEEDLYYQEAHAALEEAMDGAPGADYVRMEFWQGKTVPEIAEECNLPAKKVRREKNKCLERMSRKKVLIPYKKDIKTNYFQHISISKFQATGISATEAIAFKHLDKETQD